jgi:uncharacterized protein Veg
MIKQRKSLTSIKEEIKQFYQKDVSVKVNLGRNKTTTYIGKLTGIYQSLITVSPYGKYLGKTNFSYADLLCGLVKLEEIKIC